jgi:hypothetical protein
VVAEQVAEDRNQDPDPDHEEEDLEGDEEEFPEADVGEGQRQGCFLSAGWMVLGGVGPPGDFAQYPPARGRRIEIFV